MGQSEWTLETLKEHLECQLEAIDKRHTELATERNRAVDAALAAANEKAAAHNDVLGAMKEQRVLYVTKEENRVRFNTLAAAIGVIGVIVAIVNATRLWG